MIHLKIELNNGVIEEVSSEIIEKLYNIVHNDDLDNTSNLIGRLHTSATYQDYIDYLEDTFKVNGVKLLIIDASKKYISFADPEVKRVLTNRWGDGNGITLTDMAGVTEIPWGLFENNKTITSFNELGKFTNVIRLANNCFNNASNLTFIDLSNIEEVGGNTISGTSILIINAPKLRSISGQFCSSEAVELYIGSQVPDSLKITSLPSNFARDRNKLLIITGLKMINTLSNSCFYNCSALQSVDLTSQLTSIGESTFSGCSSLIGNIDLSNVTIINTSAFSGCSALTTVGDLSNVTSIGTYAFNGCSLLTNINLSNVTTIGGRAFLNCTSLISIGNSSNLISISDNAFNGCSSLTTIDLSNLKSIGSNAFVNCTSLGTNLILELNLQNQNSTSMENAFYNTKYKGLILHIPLSAGGRYNYPAWEKMNSLEFLDLSDARFSFDTFGLYVDNLAPLKTIILGETFSKIHHRSCCEYKPLIQYLILLSPNVVSFYETNMSERIFRDTWAPNLHIYVLNSTLVSEYLADSVWSNVENLNTHIHPLSELPAGVWTTGLASSYLTPAQLVIS